MSTTLKIKTRDVLIYDENHNLISKKDLMGSGFSSIFNSGETNTTTELDFTLSDEYFPPLDNLTKKKYNGVNEQKVGWIVSDLNERVRVREERKKLDDEIKTIENERRKREEKKISDRVTEEEGLIKNLYLTKKNLTNDVKKYDTDISLLKKEISSLNRLNRKNIKTFGPHIVKNDPTIKYDEPAFIETTPKYSWQYNVCGCGGSTTMCRSMKYNDSNQILIDAAHKKFLSDKKYSTITVHEDARYGDVVKTAHIIDFSDMTYSVSGSNRKSIANIPGNVVSVPNPNYKGPRPIHEMFQMRSFDDQFEDDFAKIPLHKSSTEYKMVENNFLTDTCGTFRTMKSVSATVTGITKVVNPVAAKFYELAKDMSENKTEVMVYHGTRTTDVNTVAQEGLDSRVGAGGYYGQAIYGSDSAFYSHNGYRHTAGRSYTILYVKFLVGKVKDSSIHDTSLTKNPPGFDSVRNSSYGEEGIRTVYENSRSYIEYMIHYTAEGY